MGLIGQANRAVRESNNGRSYAPGVEKAVATPPPPAKKAAPKAAQKATKAAPSGRSANGRFLPRTQKAKNPVGAPYFTLNEGGGWVDGKGSFHPALGAIKLALADGKIIKSMTVLDEAVLVGLVADMVLSISTTELLESVIDGMIEYHRQVEETTDRYAIIEPEEAPAA